MLFAKYEIDNRLETEVRYKRFSDPEIDGVGKPRWNNETKRMLDIIEEENFKRIVEETVESLRYRILAEGRKRSLSLIGIRQFILKRIHFYKFRDPINNH
jgi:hypothetical protein